MPITFFRVALVKSFDKDKKSVFVFLGAAGLLEDTDEKHYNVVLAQSQPHSKQFTISDLSDIKEDVNNMTIPCGILVYAVGTEARAFGIPGVKKVSAASPVFIGFFIRALPVAEKLRERVMDCIESAAFSDESEEEADRLMHIIVGGGRPTGVEFSDELHGFIKGDLCLWYHELADRPKIILLEALPNVLPMFSRELTQYGESMFKEQNIEVLTKTMVKEVKYKTVVEKNYKGSTEISVKSSTKLRGVF